ncbi:SAG family member [Eimeria mitis]|uniref:SAG family member n=1 Tax=Eimeria mitis TaxID=44415 RepID=U6JQ12_9EIME|nr:SAG family member [Eimeria mitis]CDJ26951.1 SAG family member [Eimeria mitis]
MGPIFKGTAVVCLVALSGLKPATGALSFQAEEADNAAAAEPSAEACEESIAKVKKTHFFAQLTDAEDQEYRQAVENALKAGLKELQSYPENDGEWTKFWAKPDGANLAHLLSSNSTKVGCAVGTCTQTSDELRTPETSITYLFCQMDPAAVKDKAPFDKEYYEALKERNTPLTEMTDEDLKAPVQGGAAAAVPSLLVAGLTAIVAFASA